MPEPRRDIPEERKTAFYLGTVIMAIGALSFGSCFLSFAIHFGDFNPGPHFGQSLTVRGFGGMLLLIIGSFVRNIGTRGLAGSGVVLNPKKAREDLEPWSRMAGGVVNDALSEVDALKKSETPTAIKVRCPSCRALNDEVAKFCDQCGAKI